MSGLSTILMIPGIGGGAAAPTPDPAIAANLRVFMAADGVGLGLFPWQSGDAIDLLAGPVNPQHFLHYYE